jgi:exodeoxyribonuclease VII small subunit
MAKQKFEESLARLEQITRDLEEGELSLEESLKIFDEGVKLAEYCNRKLDEAQKRVDLLLKKGGVLTAVPFEEAEQPLEADEK